MEKFSLLYVDDEESNLRIFKDTFRRKFNIFIAISAKKGMEILDNHKIDLVLSDQRMPEMTGVEFLQYSLEKFPEPNRILITGYSDMDAIENAINYAHIFQYIQKPWDEKKLLQTIEKALKIYHLEQENKRHKKEIILAKEKIEKSDRLKTEFLNNLSHEIRTPMNAILGFTDFLDNNDITKETRCHYISIIKSSGMQLLKIIDDILEISALETKQIKVTEKEVCLNNLLLEQFTIYSVKAKENKIPLYLKNGLSEEESIIITDEKKLQKIISNLLENAVKFTNKGYIEFGYHLKNEILEIYVQDTGVGINEDKQETIFKRFSQENKELSQKVGGLGLGLSIAKENTELLGGEITLLSEKHKGATFYVKIPYNRPIQVHVTETPEKSSEDSYTILIAEDEETNYLFLEILLNKIYPNLELLHAKNGQEAVDICNGNSKIDLILMDLKMPVLNGYQASTNIKEFRPELKIIAQTSYSTKEDKEKAISAGCDDFISKPINIDEMKDLLKKYLHKSQ